MFRYKTTATLGAALLAIVLAADTIAFTQIVASSPGKKLRAATPQEMKILTDQMKNMLSRSADDLSVVRHRSRPKLLSRCARFGTIWQKAAHSCAEILLPGFYTPHEGQSRKYAMPGEPLWAMRRVAMPETGIPFQQTPVA